MNEGRKQFPLFLHRSTSLKLVRFGDVYLWIEPIASNNAHDTEASATATTAPTSLKDSSGAAAAATSGGGEEDSVDARLGHFTIPYWLILTHQMQEDTVTALLYSYSLPHAEKTPIFKQVFVCERFFVLLFVRIFLACMCARSCDISSARVLAYRLPYGALIFCLYLILCVHVSLMCIFLFACMCACSCTYRERVRAYHMHFCALLFCIDMYICLSLN